MEHDRFDRLVKDVLAKREDSMLEKNLAININSEIADISRNSRMVTGMVFIFNFFYSLTLKISLFTQKEHPFKKWEIKEIKQKEEEEKIDSNIMLHKEIDELRDEFVVKEREIEHLQADRAILVELYDLGLIDEQGILSSSSMLRVISSTFD